MPYPEEYCKKRVRVGRYIKEKFGWAAPLLPSYNCLSMLLYFTAHSSTILALITPGTSVSLFMISSDAM